VLIADDHIIMRNGVRQVCESVSDITVAGEAATGDEVLKVLKNKNFDLIVLDLNMPGISGLELIKLIHFEYPKLPILIFSMRHELHIAQKTLQAGATGFVTKGSGPNTLISAIKMVAAGEKFLDASILDKMMFEQMLPNTSVKNQQLSVRELQIMELIVKGKSVNEIASDLCISNKTVSTHKSRLMHKMNIQSNTELMIFAIEYGMTKK
jgi:DNA-binding NarL/FixJ family response regulator